MERKWSVNHAAVGLLAVGLILAGCLNREGEAPAALVEPAGPEPTGADLQAFLSAPDQVTACDPIPMVFTVTNRGDHSLYLLEWYTPLEGVKGNIFRVTREGQEREYLGIMAMRGDPTRDQYITLEPGGSASAEFDLGFYYDLSQTGQYLIAYRSPWISYLGADPEDLALSVDSLGPVKIPSGAAAVSVLPGSGNCAPEIAEESPPGEDGLEVTLSGTVLDASPGAGVIQLAEDVDGFRTIALKAGAAVVDQNGDALGFYEIEPGMRLDAAGQPGAEGILIADQIIIYR